MGSEKPFSFPGIALTMQKNLVIYLFNSKNPTIKTYLGTYTSLLTFASTLFWFGDLTKKGSGTTASWSQGQSSSAMSDKLSLKPPPEMWVLKVMRSILVVIVYLCQISKIQISYYLFQIKMFNRIIWIIYLTFGIKTNNMADNGILCLYGYLIRIRIYFSDDFTVESTWAQTSMDNAKNTNTLNFVQFNYYSANVCSWKAAP